MLNPTIEIRWETMQSHSANDCSRKSWDYFMSEKFYAFDIYRKANIMVENDSRNYYCLRTDRGAEFNSYELSSFCSTNSFKRKLTAA